MLLNAEGMAPSHPNKNLLLLMEAVFLSDDSSEAAAKRWWQDVKRLFWPREDGGRGLQVKGNHVDL